MADRKVPRPAAIALGQIQSAGELSNKSTYTGTLAKQLKDLCKKLTGPTVEQAIDLASLSSSELAWRWTKIGTRDLWFLNTERPPYSTQIDVFDGIRVTQKLCDFFDKQHGFFKSAELRVGFRVVAHVLATRDRNWDQRDEHDAMSRVLAALNFLNTRFGQTSPATAADYERAQRAVDSSFVALAAQMPAFVNTPARTPFTPSAASPAFVSPSLALPDVLTAPTARQVSHSPLVTGLQEPALPALTPAWTPAQRPIRLLFGSADKVKSELPSPDEAPRRQQQQPSSLEKLPKAEGSPIALLGRLASIANSDTDLLALVLEHRRQAPRFAFVPAIVWVRDIEALHNAALAVRPPQIDFQGVDDEDLWRIALLRRARLEPVHKLVQELQKEYAYAIPDKQTTFGRWLLDVPTSRLFVDQGARVWDSATGRENPAAELGFLRMSRRLSCLRACLQAQTCVHNCSILQFDPHAMSIPLRSLSIIEGMRKAADETARSLDQLHWRDFPMDAQGAHAFSSELEHFEERVCGLDDLPAYIALAFAGDAASCDLIHSALELHKFAEHEVDKFALLHQQLFGAQDSKANAVLPPPSTQALALVSAAVLGKGNTRRVLATGEKAYSFDELRELANNVIADGGTRLALARIADALISGEMPPLPPFALTGCRVRDWLSRELPPTTASAEDVLNDVLQLATAVAVCHPDGAPQGMAYLNALGVARGNRKTRGALFEALLAATETELPGGQLLSDLGTHHIHEQRRRERHERSPASSAEQPQWPIRKSGVLGVQANGRSDAKMRKLVQQLQANKARILQVKAALDASEQDLRRVQSFLQQTPTLYDQSTRHKLAQEQRLRTRGVLPESKRYSVAQHHAAAVAVAVSSLTADARWMRRVDSDKTTFVVPIAVGGVVAADFELPGPTLFPGVHTMFYFSFPLSQTEATAVKAPFAFYICKKFSLAVCSDKEDAPLHMLPIVFFELKGEAEKGEEKVVRLQLEAGTFDAIANGQAGDRKRAAAAISTALNGAGLSNLLLAPYATRAAPQVFWHSSTDTAQTFPATVATRLGENVDFLCSGLWSTFV